MARLNLICRILVMIIVKMVYAGQRAVWGGHGVECPSLLDEKQRIETAVDA